MKMGEKHPMIICSIDPLDLLRLMTRIDSCHDACHEYDSSDWSMGQGPQGFENELGSESE